MEMIAHQQFATPGYSQTITMKKVTYMNFGRATDTTEAGDPDMPTCGSTLVSKDFSPELSSQLTEKMDYSYYQFFHWCRDSNSTGFSSSA